MVMRKKMGVGLTVKQKNVSDTWFLVDSIKRGVSVPRVMLKNGKRSRIDLQGSQQCETVRKSNFSGDSIVCEELKSGESPDLDVARIMHVVAT